MECGEEENCAPEFINPFKHEVEFSRSDKIKIALVSLTLLPIRLLASILSMTLSWAFCWVAVHGLTDDELNEKPLASWRRFLILIAQQFFRFMYFCFGFQYVSVKGRRASRKEAPIFIAAPHTSFFDTISAIYLRRPSPIARDESRTNFVTGKFLKCLQSIFVVRGNPDSRKKTLDAILERSRSSEDWPQILVFPEGTCTNGKCLITFKDGGFQSGVPVQPICLRYKNQPNTSIWTWEGLPTWKVIWLTMSQLHVSFELEFLPVYHPSEAEKKDPYLYARNVRKVISRAMNIPVCDYSFQDCKVISLAKELDLSFAFRLTETKKLQEKLGLTEAYHEDNLINIAANYAANNNKISFDEFCSKLGLKAEQEIDAKNLFQIFDKDYSGCINFQEYLFMVVLLSKSKNTTELLKFSFQISGMKCNDVLSIQEAIKAVCLATTISIKDATAFCNEADATHSGKLTLDQFMKWAMQNERLVKVFKVKSPTDFKDKQQ